MRQLSRHRDDLIAVLVLIALCWLFYWRLLTPTQANQQSLVEGDFSGQFVAFAHYQAERFAAGQVPLWNPYNYGGSPFLADAQSAVFYPPRLMTIALLNATGGSTPQRMYDALQGEMVAHALIASLLVYAFVRRLTRHKPYSIIAGLVAAITFAYSGYMTAYPQLQLAVMEAGVWIPLALLGIYIALASHHIRWRWIVVSGVALGLSLLAGHPQTSLYFGYLCLAYIFYFWTHSFRSLLMAAALFGIVGIGIAAIQLIPALEYTRLTVRAGITFDAAGNGFPFYDVAQMVFPGIVSLWSPLYFGIVGLVLAIYAVRQWRFTRGTLFWAALAVFGLALGFGHNTILYDVTYNLLPGFSLFRGQERSAFVVAVAMSVQVGLGTVAILGATTTRRYWIVLWEICAAAFALGAVLFAYWLTVPGADNKKLQLVAFSFLISLLAVVLLGYWRDTRWRPLALIGLIVFELFSFGRTNPNLEPISPADRLPTPAVVQTIKKDPDSLTARVDGTRGVRENYGTLFGVMDIQGISPLRLATVDRLLKLPASRTWEAFSVRYVPTDRTALDVPSTIVATGSDPQGAINLHKLDNPRPFARLVYKTWIEADDNAALGIFSDPGYDARNTVMLPTDPGIALPKSAPASIPAQVTAFAPEAISIHTSSAMPAMVSISLVYYPGWQATIDGQPATILRADTAMTALAMPAGDHTVKLFYHPLSFTVGALISLATLILLALAGGWFGISALRSSAVQRTSPEPTPR